MTNAEVVVAFLQKRKGQNSRLYTDGKNLESYHKKIAFWRGSEVHETRQDDEKVVTARHRGLLRDLLRLRGGPQ